MITIKGIYKGVKKREYNFNNTKGEKVAGTTNDAFIEVEDVNASPEENLVKIKLPNPAYEVITKKDAMANWTLKFRNGKLSLVSENLGAK